MSEAVEEKANEGKKENPLGTLPIGKLIVQFSVPSIIAMVVNSLYNIVDQVFIGNFVGELGNAATNIAFPLTILCLSMALMFGVGGASAFNLAMGRGEREEAPHYMGNAAVMLVVCGVLIMAVTLIFLTPLLRLFGSPDEVLPYAQSYVGITAFGFPFMVFSAGSGHLIRADGRPRASMAMLLSGAITNVVLDTLFVVVFGWGIRGAATATVIGQVVATVVALCFLTHTRNANLQLKHLRPRRKYAGKDARLGIAPCLNQLATMVVQITMNNSLKHYGGMSIYGESIPIAVVGIITKVSQIFLGVLGGIGQGVQPIASFNYGAKQYERVRSAFRRAILLGFIIAIISFFLFQLFPRQIISLFGEGSSEVYYQFAISYFRIYLMLAFCNFLPQMASMFFTAIGKPMRGTLLSLTRQIIFFLPLLLIFPAIWGIDGIMYVGPVADALAVTVCIIMLAREFKELRQQESEMAGTSPT